MASPVGYQTFCPVGAALNVVGERWALVIVRDLLLGPRTYSELLNGIGGVGTDILATRLRSLQDHGIVRKVGEGRGARYELTESGLALRPVLTELSRWGAHRLRLPDDPSTIPPRVPLTPLLLGATSIPRQANGAYEIRVDDEAVRIEVHNGCVHPAPDAQPETTIELTRPGLRALVRGARASELIEADDVTVEGNARRAAALLDAVSGPPLLTGVSSARAPREGSRL
jgi:DNA-binding HxlR family transcriptional regulator